MLNVWKMIQEKKENLQTHAKKNTIICWFPVKDIKIPDIFYKIQHFLTMSWASVIAHKDLLDLNIWMQTAPYEVENYNQYIDVDIKPLEIKCDIDNKDELQLQESP